MKKTLLMCIAIAFTSVASAQWTEISNFEDPTDVDLWTVGPNGDNTDPADLPRFILQDDPLASGQGKVVAINPGVAIGGGATSFTAALPEPFVTDESLPIGEPQYYTLFYKIHHANVAGALGKNNTTIGTIDKDNSTIGDFGFYSWPSYNMIFRDGGPAGGAEDTGLPLNGHNGTTYFMPYASATETEAGGARMPAADAYPQPDIWYNVWMVTNMDDLSAEVYFSGGQFGETARLANIIPNFRNGAATDHDTILINTSSDGINFPHSTFFDDVYSTKGKHLTDPSNAVDNPPNTTPRAVGEDVGSSTISMPEDAVSDAVVGQLVFLDDGTEVGAIASIAGQVLTLESPLSVAIAPNSRLTFVDPPPPDTTGGKLVNISTRGAVGTGDDVLIGGFVIGTDKQQVYISATGPELENAGVTGFLLDPVLTVTNIATGVETVNDNWEDTQGQLITDLWGGAPPLAAGSLSAGLVLTLDTGSYTAKISGAGDTTGTAIIEVFEID